MNPLNAETLTALSTTSSQNLTAALGGHASTEAVAFGTLTSVRLISALHIVSLSWLSATRQVYIGGNRFSKLDGQKRAISCCSAQDSHICAGRTTREWGSKRSTPNLLKGAVYEYAAQGRFIQKRPDETAIREKG